MPRVTAKRKGRKKYNSMDPKYFRKGVKLSIRGTSSSAGRRVPIALRQHSFVERIRDVTLHMNSTTINAAGNFANTYVTTIQLSDILQAGEYANLFEFYRIDKLVLKVRYKVGGQYANTDVAAGKSMNEINPYIYLKVDHDDINPDTMAVLQQSSKTKDVQLRNDAPFATFAIKPSVLGEIYKSAIASVYSPKWGVWLPSSELSIPHYGIKMNVEVPAGSTSANYGSLVLTGKLYFTMKSNQ